MLRKVKELGSIVFIFILSAMLLSSCGNKDGIALEVNKNPISIEEFKREFNIYKDEYIEQYGDDILKRETEDGVLQEDILKKEVLEKLVKEELILEEAKKSGITLKKEEVEEVLEDYIEELGGPESYAKLLEKRNVSEEEVRTDVKSQGLMDKYKNEALEKMEISENEAREFFELNKEDLIRVRAKHILTLTKEEAEEILKQINYGENFEELAIEKSKDILSAAKGGDLGYFTKSDFLIKELVDAAFQLEVGEISDVVQTEIGYHIIKLEDKKDDYESLREKTISVLKENIYLKEIEEMENKAKVKVYIEGIPKLKYEENKTGFFNRIFN